jgi:hypothetical protein
LFFHAPFLASPRTHPLHITSAKGSQMHESKTAPINQNIVLTMSEIISDDAKKSATRGDVMVLAVTTEAEFSKLRSWISARFDKMSSENTSNTDRLLRHNTFQVFTIAISAFGVVAALVANIFF